jgi:hypothetical protein
LWILLSISSDRLVRVDSQPNRQTNKENNIFFKVSRFQIYLLQPQGGGGGGVPEAIKKIHKKGKKIKLNLFYLTSVHCIVILDNNKEKTRTIHHPPPSFSPHHPPHTPKIL